MHSAAPLEPGCLAVHVLPRGAEPRRRPAGSGRADPRVRALLAAYGGPHHNLSHSGGWLYLAVSGSPVGVDLEGFARRRHGEAFRRFLLEREDPRAERAPVAPGSLDEQALAVRVWSRLEALTKCEGQGLDGALDHLRVPAGPLPEPWCVDTAQGPRWLLDLPSPAGMVASLASPVRPRHVRLHGPDDAAGDTPGLAPFPANGIDDFQQ
ncbi:4'-phosphopantetheinyl transferase superfamily protein [Aquabacterium sp. A7-Y]|uniref:4'-phosphopantetheinyl transferase family protein n=1 Tax=Aquabacterium sp. A7-Y TaxID=1349605 RepID=UPI00223DFEF5|nr:4'-phosphopantetheinyl transferase superfamily protein [Aquabacterium sp. A7-Y]MCW7540425.1 4'-phosphopantetheinyl transferase superfamily protein [Aquabacterium sp. A7-Y]